MTMTSGAVFDIQAMADRFETGFYAGDTAYRRNTILTEPADYPLFPRGEKLCWMLGAACGVGRATGEACTNSSNVDDENYGNAEWERLAHVLSEYSGTGAIVPAVTEVFDTITNFGQQNTPCFETIKQWAVSVKELLSGDKKEHSAFQPLIVFVSAWPQTK